MAHALVGREAGIGAVEQRRAVLIRSSSRREAAAGSVGDRRGRLRGRRVHRDFGLRDGRAEEGVQLFHLDDTVEPQAEHLAVRDEEPPGLLDGPALPTAEYEERALVPDDGVHTQLDPVLQNDHEFAVLRLGNEAECVDPVRRSWRPQAIATLQCSSQIVAWGKGWG